MEKKQVLSDKVFSIDILLNYSYDADLPKLEFWTKTDLAFLPFSSGTTGWPKGVMISHYNMVAMLHIIGTLVFSYCNNCISINLMCFILIFKESLFSITIQRGPLHSHASIFSYLRYGCTDERFVRRCYSDYHVEI